MIWENIYENPPQEGANITICLGDGSGATNVKVIGGEFYFDNGLKCEMAATNYFVRTDKNTHMKSTTPKIALIMPWKAYAGCGSEWDSYPYDKMVTSQTIKADLGLHMLLDIPGVPKESIGAKLNKLIGGTDADIILRIDSDDVYGPEYVEGMVNGLIESKADLVGLSSAYFLNSVPEADVSDLYEYNYVPVRPGVVKVCGATMCFWRKTWEQNKFEDVSEGEDRMFCEAVQKTGKIVALNHLREQFVAVLNGENTCSHKQLPFMRKLTEREHEMKRANSIGTILKDYGYEI